MGMDAFGGLADPVRRDLLRRLVDGPARAGDLAVGHGISRPAVSRHLRVLTEAGLVRAHTSGREHWFRLEPTGAAPVQRLLDDLGRATPATRSGPRPTEQQLMALDTEVRRTTRDRTRAETTPAPAARRPPTTQESA